MPARTCVIESCQSAHATTKPINKRHLIVDGQCIRCGAITALGELTTDCAGRKLQRKIYGLIAAGLVDLIDGQWLNVHTPKHNNDGRAQR